MIYILFLAIFKIEQKEISREKGNPNPDTQIQGKEGLPAVFWSIFTKTWQTPPEPSLPGTFFWRKAPLL